MQLALDSELQIQLGAFEVSVHASSKAKGLAQLKADALASGSVRLVELTAMACQRIVIKLQPAQLAIGLTQHGLFSTEANYQQRYSKESRKFFYLIPPNQSVVLQFHSPSVKWQHLCISTQALASCCHSIGIRSTLWEQLRPPLEQNCDLLTTLVDQLKTEPYPEANAQMILLHLACRFGQGTSHKAVNVLHGSRSEVLVRESLCFFQEQMHRQIRLAEVSEFLKTLPRRLQSAFEEFLGSTPMEILLQERLKALRNLLLSGVAVGDACRSVGLRSSGRVARLYLDQYGELPRETRSGLITSKPDQMISSDSSA